jgi:hypothetical protein
VIVERDTRPPRGPLIAKLERYEHFLAGWSASTQRYGLRLRALSLVVFVCRDRAHARACARSADRLLRACRAYPGEYPRDWQYQGREQIVFAAERDMHEGVPLAYGVPGLPPEVRIAAANGDPGAGESSAEEREILPSWRAGDRAFARAGAAVGPGEAAVARRTSASHHAAAPARPVSPAADRDA